MNIVTDYIQNFFRILNEMSPYLLLGFLFARAVVIIDETGKIIYTEQVPEITQ